MCSELKTTPTRGLPEMTFRRLPYVDDVDKREKRVDSPSNENPDGLHAVARAASSHLYLYLLLDSHRLPNHGTPPP
jgi:hypothetical protein